MQFIDQARITVRGGRGGDGIAAFRREKYVPAGGPSGGDGGCGAPVVLEADSNLQTLLDFKYKRLFAADDGRRGGPNKCTGASGKDLVIKVPCGTEVRHLRTGILLGDLTTPGERLTVAFGGRGGLGNAHYLSNRNRAPEKFTEGREGEEWPCSWNSSCWLSGHHWSSQCRQEHVDRRAVGSATQDCRLPPSPPWFPTLVWCAAPVEMEPCSRIFQA